MNRRHVLTTAVALAVAPLAAVRAQDAWPTKPIKLISPFPAGGTSDVMARMIAAPLSKELGQQGVVENIGGAGGVIGTARSLTMAPDGYTLIQTGVGQNAVAHGLDPKISYDSMRDFIHITQVHSGPNVLVAHPSAPFNTFKEFIAYVQKNPNKLNYGYTHAASGHMAMELLRQTAKLDMVGVPYKGGGPMMNDILGGQFPVMFINQDVALPHIKAGKLKALAVTTSERAPALPDVPTIAESGLPGFEASSWFGLLAPAGTPREIVLKINGEIARWVATPEAKEKMTAIGANAKGGTPEDFVRHIADETAKWQKVVKESGAKVD